MKVIRQFTYGSSVRVGDISSGSSFDPLLDWDEIVEGRNGRPSSFHRDFGIPAVLGFTADPLSEGIGGDGGRLGGGGGGRLGLPLHLMSGRVPSSIFSDLAYYKTILLTYFLPMRVRQTFGQTWDVVKKPCMLSTKRALNADLKKGF